MVSNKGDGRRQSPDATLKHWLFPGINIGRTLLTRDDYLKTQTQSMCPDRRFIIAAGTEHYPEYGEEGHLRRVPNELKTIADAFAGLGYESVRSEAWLDPTANDLREGISGWYRAPERDSNDIVVLYYSGHGEMTNDNQYYLLTTNSAAGNLAGTAVPADEIARWALVDTRPRRVLVILDSCFAGEGVQEFLEKALRQLGSSGRTVVGIAAASHRDQAAQEMFATAFAREIHDPRWGGESLEYLPLSSLIQGIARKWKVGRQGQRLFPAMFGDELDAFLPNPRYHAELPRGLDLRTQRRLSAMSPEEFLIHWGPRSRGVEFDQQHGWYFTGRHAALRRIASWLVSDAAIGSNIFWVTGDPGSGKSAVISRIVTLSDPGLREDPAFRERTGLEKLSPETVPPSGAVDLAIHARRKTLRECVQALSAATGIESEEPADLVRGLTDQRFCIVIDALDEALESERIWDELLQPLGGVAGVKILIGARRSHLPRDSEGVLLDLDQPGWFDPEDVASYAERILVAGDEPDRDTPYREKPGLARQVAVGIAERAGHVFLVAQLAARALADRPDVIETSDRAWKEQLPGDFATAFDEYLGRLGPEESRARDLLRPLAYAEGAGFPWEHLWAPSAKAMASAAYDDSDVQWALDQFADYLLEDVEDGHSVYRLYHEKFAEYLRGPEAESRRRDQGRLGEALVHSVQEGADGRREWARAHSYVRRHLATHLAEAGSLDSVMDDPGYLVAADDERLLRVLDSVSSDVGRTAVRVYRQAVHRLRECPLEEGLSYLQLVAARLGVTWPEVVHRAHSWHPVWVHGKRTSDHLILARLSAKVCSIAVGEFDARSVVVSGTHDGTVQVWDMATGVALGAPLTGHRNIKSSVVRSVAIAVLEGRPVIVSAGNDRTVRVWDLATGTPRGAPLVGDTQWGVPCVAIGTVEGRQVIASGGEDGTVRVWDLETLVPSWAPVVVDEWVGVTSVAVSAIEGRPVFVSGGSNGTVRVWDLGTGAPVGQPLKGHNNEATVAVGALAGRPVIVSGGDEGTVRVWDLETGAPYGTPLLGHKAAVTCVAVGALEGQPVIVSGSNDRTVRVWDLATGVPYAGPLTGHTRGVTGVAVGTVEGRSVIVSGSGDATVRVWDRAMGLPLGAPLKGHELQVNTVAVGTLDGRSMIVSGSSDRTVRVWDLATGAPYGSPLWGHSAPVRGVAIVDLERRPLVVSGGGWDKTIRVWDLTTGAFRGEMRGHERGITSVAAATLEGRPVAVSGDDDGMLLVWDVETGGLRGAPLAATGREVGVKSVAVGTVEGRSVIVSGGKDGMVRVWDLATGAPLGELMNTSVQDLQVNSVAVGTLAGQPVIVSGGSDQTVRVWDLATGTPRGAPLTGHERAVTSVAVGTLEGLSVIVSGSWDQTVRVWDLATRQAQVIWLDTPVIDLALADGKLLVAGEQGLALLSVRG